MTFVTATTDVHGALMPLQPGHIARCSYAVELLLAAALYGCCVAWKRSEDFRILIYKRLALCMIAIRDDNIAELEHKRRQYTDCKYA